MKNVKCGCLILLARQAADAIERIRAEEAIQESEKRAHTLVEELRKMDEIKISFEYAFS